MKNHRISSTPHHALHDNGEQIPAHSRSAAAAGTSRTAGTAGTARAAHTASSARAAWTADASIIAPARHARRAGFLDKAARPVAAIRLLVAPYPRAEPLLLPHGRQAQGRFIEVAALRSPRRAVFAHPFLIALIPRPHARLRRRRVAPAAAAAPAARAPLRAPGRGLLRAARHPDNDGPDEGRAGQRVQRSHGAACSSVRSHISRLFPGK